MNRFSNHFGLSYRGGIQCRTSPRDIDRQSREVDNRAIGSGSRGKITEVLQSEYFKLVQGRRQAPDGWLTYVE